MGTTEAAKTAAPLPRLRGQVEGMNDRGIKLAGRWVNFSDFHKVPVRPDVGFEVDVELTRDEKWIKSLAIIAEPEAVTLSALGGPPTSMEGRVSTKDRLIIRQCAIKAAAEFCASKPESTRVHVTEIAEEWENWVMRDLV